MVYLVVWLIMAGIPTLGVLAAGVWLLRRQFRSDTVSRWKMIAAGGMLFLGIVMAVVVAIGALFMVPGNFTE